MANDHISYVGIDTLQLDATEVAQVKSDVEKRLDGLRASEGKLRVHFTFHNADGARAQYCAHLFFEHGGHHHTSDKHEAWDLREAIDLAFNALESQLRKETPNYKGKPTVRKMDGPEEVIRTQ